MTARPLGRRKAITPSGPGFAQPPEETAGAQWLGCSFFTGARNYSGVLSVLLIPQLLNPPSIYPHLWAIPGTLAPRPGCSYVGRAQSGFLTVNGALGEAGKHSHIGRMLRKIPFIKPMAPTLAKVPPAGPDWLHEVKFDGWRAQIHIEDGAATLYSKNGADIHEAISARCGQR